MYKVLLERRAEKDLDVLELSLRKRITEHLLLLAKNPKSSGCKKLAGAKNAYRIRVSDLRVIYEISDKDKQVKIYRIKHRAKAY